MKNLSAFVLLIPLVFFCSCGAPTEVDTSYEVDSTLVSEEVFDSSELNMGSALAGHYDEFYDTTTVIEFVEMTITINRLVVYDEEGMLTNLVEGDSVYLWVELSETVEGQQISVDAHGFKDIKLEQRYETSISAYDEGPHCDLTDWKHFVSEWETIESVSENNFITKVYTEEEGEMFPKVTIPEVNKQIEKQCPGFMDLVKDAKSIREYPYGVGISRVYFRISAERIDNGEMIEKILVFDIPMGC